MKTFYTIGLLALSNTFMTFAWYGHLKFREFKWFETLPLVGVVLISWGIALFEYFSRFRPTALVIKKTADHLHLSN